MGLPGADAGKKRRDPRRPVQCGDAFATILEGRRVLGIRCALSQMKAKCVRDAARIILEPQNTTRRRQYRVFLHDLHQKCGPQGVLLCAAELGQHKLMTMRKNDRAALLDMLELNKDLLLLQDGNVHVLATECGVPDMVDWSSNSSMMADPPSCSSPDDELQSQEASAMADPPSCSSPDDEIQSQEGSRVDAEIDAPLPGPEAEMSLQPPLDYQHSTCAQAIVCPSIQELASYPNSMDGESVQMPTDQFVFDTGLPSRCQYASLHNFKSVFSDYLFAAVRRVPSREVSDGFVRASVTSIVPAATVPIGCMVSLEVYEWSVKFICMALFQVDMKWVQRKRHINIFDGTTLALEEQTATLRGGLVKSLELVFGSLVAKAIRASPVGKQNVEECSERTDLVSMSFLNDGAILNISLDCHQSAEINRLLFA